MVGPRNRYDDVPATAVDLVRQARDRLRTTIDTGPDREEAAFAALSLLDEALEQIEGDGGPRYVPSAEGQLLIDAARAADRRNRER